MKKAVFSLVLGGCLVASGCVAQNGAFRTSKADGDIDEGKVDAVNQWAERRHATVLWINYPRKAKDPAQTTSSSHDSG
jgi:hypothetical protein